MLTSTYDVVKLSKVYHNTYIIICIKDKMQKTEICKVYLKQQQNPNKF